MGGIVTFKGARGKGCFVLKFTMLQLAMKDDMIVQD
jgi:hypothetical protein